MVSNIVRFGQQKYNHTSIVSFLFGSLFLFLKAKFRYYWVLLTRVIDTIFAI